MDHSTCTTCHSSFPANTIAQLAFDASRWACPICGEVTDYAAQQVAKATSPDAKEFWNAVGAVAVVAGLLILVDRMSQWA